MWGEEGGDNCMPPYHPTPVPQYDLLLSPPDAEGYKF